MFKVAIRNVRSHFVRMIMSLVAVILGVSFVSGTLALSELLNDTFDSAVDSGYSTDAYLRGGTEQTSMDSATPGIASYNMIPASFAEKLETLPEVSHASPGYNGSVILVGGDGTAVTSMGPPIFGLNWDERETSLKLVSGTYPTNSQEFALEKNFAERSRLEVGQSTKLIIGGEITEAKLVGLAEFSGQTVGAGIVLFDEATAAQIFAPEGLVQEISITAAKGVSEKELKTAVNEKFSDSIEGISIQVNTGAEMRQITKDSISEMLGFVQIFLMIFAGISLFVGAFIIANTFNMTVSERQREFALLRAIGASPRQVFTSILVQAGTIGLLGGLIGVGGGLGLVALLQNVLGATGMELSGTIPVTTSSVIVSLLVGFVVSLVAAALPARRAAITPPVEAMREQVSSTQKNLRIRTIAGLLILVLGLAALGTSFFAALADEENSNGTLLGVGAAGIVLAALLLAPVLAKPVITVLAWPLQKAFKPLGKLAQGNVVRNPRRTSSTASSLMIGMALVGAVGVLATSTTASMKSVVESELKGDLILQSASLYIPAGAATAMQDVPQVGILTKLSVDVFEVVGSENPAYTVGAPKDLFDTSWNLDAISGDLDSFKSGDALVQKATAKRENWKVGDEITLTGTLGETNIRIGGVIDSAGLGGNLIIPEDIFEKLSLSPQDKVNTIIVTGAEGVSLEQLRGAVTDVVKEYLVVSVYDQEEFVSMLADQVNQILVILYALLGLSIVIAVLGIINTLALSVVERTREIGLLRAVGLSRGQLSRTITIESILISVYGTVLGLAVGVGVAATLPTVFANQGFTTLEIDWASLFGMVVLAIIIGWLASLWPAWRANRMPVLDAVSSD